MMLDKLKSVPVKSRLYFLLAAFFILLPVVAPYYKGVSGKLLVAMPATEGSLWQDTVIFISDDGWEGTAGVILNRPIAVPEKNTPQYIRNKNVPLYYGGPVGYPEKVFVGDFSGDKLTVTLLDRLVAENPGILDGIVSSLRAGEDRYKIYLGSAGWAPFQIAFERWNDVWTVTDFNADWIYLKDRALWEAAYQKVLEENPTKLPGKI